MKQTEPRTIQQQQQSFSNCWQQQQKHFKIGNFLFELDSNISNNLSSPNSQSNLTNTSFASISEQDSSYQQKHRKFSEEENYSLLLKLKQQLHPVSFIQANNKSNQVEATFLQEKSSNINYLDQFELQYETSMLKPQYKQLIEKYFTLRSIFQGNCQNDQQSDSGITTNSIGSNQETKEKIFLQFCNQEITKINDLNGKQQIFQYTVIQCIEDEFTPYIYKIGFSESLISLLGSSRNNFQQILMRQGPYLPFHQEIRNSTIFSHLESFLLCHEKIHEGLNFHTYNQACQLETFERLFFNCQVNKYVIPCVFQGQLLGIIVLDLFQISGSVIKGLLSKRKSTNNPCNNYFIPEGYKQQTELFLQKFKRYSA